MPDPMNLEVRSGDVTLCVQVFGEADGPPILLIMGATASMLWWPEELCEALSALGYRVVRYDHRDTGRSTSVPLGEAAYAAEDMADDALAVLDGLGLANAHLVGMSLGGLIGQILAVRQPERVRSLTLIGAEPLGWAGDELPTIAPVFMDHFSGLATLDWTDRSDVAQFMLQIARLSAGNRASFDARRELRRIEGEIDRAPNIASAFNHGSVALREDWTGRTADIAVPTLILHGEQDPIAPLANGAALAQAIPGARLHVLSGVGHELPAAALDEIVGTLGLFLRQADAAPKG